MIYINFLINAINIYGLFRYKYFWTWNKKFQIVLSENSKWFENKN